MGIAGTIVLVVMIAVVLVFMIGLIVYCFRETGVYGATRRLIKEAEEKKEEKRQEKVYSDLVEMIIKRSEKVD